MTSTGKIAVRAWLVDRALPLWADAGVDPRGGFIECFTLDGRPDHEAPKRVRVQARQIYVYSHAHALGLGRDLIAAAWKGYRFAREHAWLPSGGWVHKLSREGVILDARRDCYDHAFVLLALAWLYLATGEREIKTLIDDTIRFLDAELAHPLEAGYREDSLGTLPRRQNPHMHLMEAWLALFEATRDDAYLRRARKLLLLFERVFLDRPRGALREYFTDDWQRIDDPATDFFEPGHHFEWVWLLHRYARLAGEPVRPEAALLLRTAVRNGLSAAGLALDEIWMSGPVKKATARCWPLTEALKASLCTHTQEPFAGFEPDAIVARLFTHYLAGPVPGLWWDTVDETLQPHVYTVPASTLYHLFLAFAEYLDAPHETARAGTM